MSTPGKAGRESWLLQLTKLDHEKSICQYFGAITSGCSATKCNTWWETGCAE